MIVEEINIHPEPQYVPATSQSIVFTGAAQKEKEDAEKLLKFLSAKEEAQKIYKERDLVTLTTNTKSQVKIIRLLDHVYETILYQGECCVVEAKNPTYINASPVKYSLPELDPTSIIREEQNATC